MFERFTGHARTIMVLARDEANDLDHDHVGTEDLLIGLLGASNAVAALLWTALASPPKPLADSSSRPSAAATGRSKAPTVLGTRAEDGRAGPARRVALQDNYIGTEHLLLGLQGVQDGLGARLLRQQGVDADLLRQAVLDERAKHTGS